MKYWNLVTCLFLTLCSFAQNDEIYNDDPFQKHPLGFEPPAYQYRYPTGGAVDEARIEPPFWWAGMAQPEVELLIYDENIRDLEPEIEHYGIVLIHFTRLENPNYLFLKIHVDPKIEPGFFQITLKDENGNTQKSYSYEIKERSTEETGIQGVDAADFIYLIMPDRFANGDRGNDSYKNLQQVGINRDKAFFRHGGDLIGIMEHLDYIEELGATALCINPVLESNQASESYHGDAVTDHYKIDPRYGSNETYVSLVKLAHARGMKVIMDGVLNHTGDQHWFIKDLPSEYWIHQWEDSLRQISYRAAIHTDPYASSEDYAQVTKSWLHLDTPDLNPQQPQLANYLIQNSIWWTAFSGHDGFRIGDYAHCDPVFMAEWNRRMLEEFPQISIFGEISTPEPGLQSWFAEGKRSVGHDSHLPGVADFPLFYAITEALNSRQGVAQIYHTLAQDYLYENPYNNVIFLDNHNLNRIYSTLGEDLTKFKSAISLLLTMRGIPMLYYGSEMLMTGEEGGRKDFPGGWRRDKPNLFKERNRSADQQGAFEHISRLAKYRRENEVLQNGQLTQYAPENGIYTFFRHQGAQTVMITYNSNEQASTLNTSRFQSMIDGYYTGGRNIISGEGIKDITQLLVQAKETLVIELH